jgi:hypothetical protein
MATAARLYIDDVFIKQKSPVGASATSWTMIDAACYHNEDLNGHYDYLKVASGLYYPVQEPTWDVLDWPFNTLTGWTYNASHYEISPAGQLHAHRTSTGVDDCRYPITNSLEDYTIEFVCKFQYLYTRLAADETIQGVRCLFTGGVVRMYFWNDGYDFCNSTYSDFTPIVDTWYKIRIMFSSDGTFPEEPAEEGSAQLHGWTTNISNVGLSNRGVQTNWYKPDRQRIKG